MVPPPLPSDWASPGVCGRGGAQAGDAAEMVQSTGGSSFCAGRTRPRPIPGLQGAFKMQVRLRGGGRWER